MRRYCILLALSPLLLTPSTAMGTGAFTSAMLMFQSERIISAFSVATKQNSLSSNVANSAMYETGKGIASAMTAIRINADLTNAVISFSPSLGQPYLGHCGAQVDAATMTAAGEQANRDAQRLMSSFSSVRVGSQVAAEKEKLDIRKNTYCTLNEARQGYCTLTANGLQAADVDYATSVAAAKTLAPEGEIAAYAYTTMVTDARAEMQGDCRSSACEAAQAKHLATSAANAMAATALIGQITARRITTVGAP